MYNSKLKSRRENMSLTQRELAEKSGVSIRLIQYYEQGFRDIRHARAEAVQSLADVLKCSVKDLL